ncbi:MAG TPA: STAS domain-containing protein [Ignavibacteria bacterium]|nr:STAS domain-containing protein [Ignavibacteria bacterium]HQY51479.1 STAS domain-containing protein [Ignavibacteria bacterium]HRA99209.1 STAS domain-containing protein [Ignavibacteria bacterium]
MEEFSIKTKQHDNVSILDLEGYLDAHTSVELEKCLEKIISENKFKIIVNFEKLSYISSAGLGVFMAFIETARNNAGDIKLCAMSDKIYNIFDMLGFPILFEIYKEENSALEKFS